MRSIPVGLEQGRGEEGECELVKGDKRMPGWAWSW